MSTKLFSTYLPNDRIIISRVNTLINVINQLPRNDKLYMLIHTDLHSGNFFFDDERLWIFDFDDCAYHFIVHDLAMPLYYFLWQFEGTREEKVKFGTNFLTIFLAGYLATSEIALDEFLKLPIFLKLRDCDLYGINR
ncbi:phosphotransferase [Evansella sp. AB-P1]|uniref:phosphotransferase n=1 Tax=Evansella sp. AB-P1 TaxID=3037653 RepID=UPI00241D6A6B|nr:phosphotransferase [Evansella sp. AB-P1]MDG5789651.1 phosphotransferase [Evansella sp. AB-P1]